MQLKIETIRSAADRKIARRIRDTRRRSIYLRERHDDLMALSNLNAIGAGYLPWSGSSLNPATVQRICNDIVLNDRRTVAEFGAGVSTLVLAALKRHLDLDLRVYAIDEDAAWLEIVRKALNRAGNSDSVELIHAPLSAFPRTRDEPIRPSRWYVPSALSNLPTGLDVVICDGPTAYTYATRFDRWPALPQAYPLLSADCAVILDDINRPGERTILESWSGKFPEFTIRTHAYSAFMTRGGRRTV